MNTPRFRRRQLWRSVMAAWLPQSRRWVPAAAGWALYLGDHFVEVQYFGG